MTRKKTFKIILVSIFTLSILGIIICGIYTGYIFLKTKDVELKSESQIRADSIVFDADMSYVTTDRHLLSKISRLGYNKNAPIKVVLKENLDVRTKSIITQAYADVINPIMAQINDNYFFEVINEKDFKRTSSDKVIIRFESGKEVTGMELIFTPLATTNYNYLSAFINPLLTDLKIIINEFFFDEETSHERILHIVVHEILHTLGFDDVYDVDNYSTMLKSDINNELLKPNDIRALAALYFEDYGNLDSLQEWILIYTEEYYKKYSELFLDTEIDEYDIFDENFFLLKGSVEIIDIHEFDTLNLVGVSETYGLNYQFNLCENGTFYYYLADTDSQEVLEEKIGRYYFYNGKIFLGIFDIRSYEYIFSAELLIVNTENGFELVCIGSQLMRLHYTEQIIMRVC